MSLFNKIVKQILYVILLFAIPYYWIQFILLFDFSGHSFVLNLGFLAIIESYLYLNLPLDLIPDFIPIIGRFDNIIAYLIGLVGFWMCLVIIYNSIMMILT